MRGRFHAGLRREAGEAFCARNSARLKGGLGVEIPIALSFPDNRALGVGPGPRAARTEPSRPVTPPVFGGLSWVCAFCGGKDRG